jgi:hypothetical protein
MSEGLLILLVALLIVGVVLISTPIALTAVHQAEADAERARAEAERAEAEAIRARGEAEAAIVRAQGKVSIDLGPGNRRNVGGDAAVGHRGGRVVRLALAAVRDSPAIAATDTGMGRRRGPGR